MEGLVTLFWRLTPPATVLHFFFLGSYRFSGTYASRVALIAPDIDKFILWVQECDVPSRGHVGTSQMSSWLKEENSSVLYAQLHFVALGRNLIALPFRVSSLKDALVLTAVFTEAVLSVENPTWDVQESVILHNVQLSFIFVPLVLFFSPFVPRRQYNWLLRCRLLHSWFKRQPKCTGKLMQPLIEQKPLAWNCIRSPRPSSQILWIIDSSS